MNTSVMKKKVLKKLLAISGYEMTFLSYLVSSYPFDKLKNQSKGVLWRWIYR